MESWQKLHWHKNMNNKNIDWPSILVAMPRKFSLPSLTEGKFSTWKWIIAPWQQFPSTDFWFAWKWNKNGDISQNWWRMCLKITDLWKYRKYAFCQVFLARWQDETIFALIIVRTTRRTGSRISNARGDIMLFVSIILKLFPHSPTQNESVWWWWFC